MSNIRTGTISGVNGTDPVTLTKQNAAKAWGNLNGSGTPAFRDSFNYSSIVDNGTGDFTHNFTSNMANANYSLTATGTSSYAFWSVATNTGNTLAGSIKIRTYTSNVALTDSQLIFSTIHGDLA